MSRVESTPHRYMETVKAHLIGLGFVEVEHERGAMATETWKLARSRTHFLLKLDRGNLPWVGLGKRDGDPYVAPVWASVLGIAYEGDLEFQRCLDFLVDHVDEIEKRIESDPRVEDSLKDANWILVKKRLNLPPDMPPPAR